MNALKHTLAIVTFSLAAGTGHATVLSPESHVAVAPDIAVNANGDIAILWVDRAPELRRDPSESGERSQLPRSDLYVTLSQDAGETFGVPVKVNHDPNVVRGQTINRPRIAAGSDGTWHISYAANEVHPAAGKPVMASHYTRSTDGGRTFEAPRRLSALPDVDRSDATHGGFMSTAGFQTIAVTPGGHVQAFWIDTRFRTAHNDAGALFTALSQDGGATFGADQQLLATNVCPCCQLMTALDSDGGIFLGMRDVSPEGLRQPVVTRFDTRTGTLSEQVDAGYADWEIAGCPLKPTALTVRSDKVFTAVYSGGEARPGVFFSSSSDGGRSFSNSVAVHADAAVSDAPTIAVNDRYVLVAWHAKTDGARQIFYRLYAHNGTEAGDVLSLSSGPENASNPVAAVLADGRFQIAWSQGDRIHTAVVPPAPREIEMGLR